MCLNKIKFIFFFAIVMVSMALSPRYLCAEQSSLKIATGHEGILSGNTKINGGVFPDIVRTALQQVGYSIEVIFVPWKRGFYLTKAGEYDGLMMVSYNKERLKYFEFSEPVLHEELMLFCKKGKNITYNFWEDLALYKIGAIRGSLVSELLKSKNIKVEEVSRHEQNIEKLVRGRVDLIACSKLRLQKLVNTKFPGLKKKIEMVSPPLYLGTLHFVISRNVPSYETIIHNFNRGLQIIRADGTFNRILQAHGFEMLEMGSGNVTSASVDVKEDTKTGTDNSK